MNYSVKALWLQYYGLRAGGPGTPEWIENAARVTDRQEPAEDLPEIKGLMVAT